jgi:hypothetical protein
LGRGREWTYAVLRPTSRRWPSTKDLFHLWRSPLSPKVALLPPRVERTLAASMQTFGTRTTHVEGSPSHLCVSSLRNRTRGPEPGCRHRRLASCPLGASTQSASSSARPARTCTPNGLEGWHSGTRAVASSTRCPAGRLCGSWRDARTRRMPALGRSEPISWEAPRARPPTAPGWRSPRWVPRSLTPPIGSRAVRLHLIHPSLTPDAGSPAPSEQRRVR